MAIVEPVSTYDVQTKARGRAFTVSLEESPTFEDKKTAELVAAEINAVLKRFESD